MQRRILLIRRDTLRWQGFPEKCIRRSLFMLDSPNASDKSILPIPLKLPTTLSLYRAPASPRWQSRL